MKYLGVALVLFIVILENINDNIMSVCVKIKYDNLQRVCRF
ncbi:hypothetical protein SAMN05216388_11162 [Halorientalis persicus]|uniref:Uncharacterized protein n=1 Tax=Halorientalis persicus TaxID=1367881 RepID=A0A1H8X545_9EURY|nr:hypothetical protein SAMN05216388_11162 [Halorientalis persicus]